MKAVQEGKSIGVAANLMRAVKAMGGGHETADLYGFDDSAMKEAEQMATVATKKQRDLSERLAAITGAAKRPELAAKEGIDVRNPTAVVKRIAQLRAERAEWDNWHTDPKKIAAIRDELGQAPLPEHAPAVEPQQDNQTAAMFSRANQGEENGRAVPGSAAQAGQDRGAGGERGDLAGNDGAGLEHPTGARSGVGLPHENGIPQGLPRRTTDDSLKLASALTRQRDAGGPSGVPLKIWAIRPDSLPHELSETFGALEKLGGLKVVVTGHKNPHEPVPNSRRSARLAEMSRRSYLRYHSPLHNPIIASTPSGDLSRVHACLDDTVARTLRKIRLVR
jgi:hypothetical protein